MGLKMFKFRIQNTATGEIAAFMGQGENVQDAWKDGTSNVGATFRPKGDGKARASHGVAVTLKDGRIVTRQMKNFEGDEPYTDAEKPQDFVA